MLYSPCMPLAVLFSGDHSAGALRTDAKVGPGHQSRNSCSILNIQRNQDQQHSYNETQHHHRR